MNTWLKTLLVLSLAFFFSPVFAQSTVFSQQAVVMYAGPGYNYPPVAQIYPGENLQLYGCLQYFSWCDVENMQNRGWVASHALGMQRSGRVVYLDTEPSLFNPPIIFFNIGTYWGQHYRHRSWYPNWRHYPQSAPSHRPSYRSSPRDHYGHYHSASPPPAHHSHNNNYHNQARVSIPPPTNHTRPAPPNRTNPNQSKSRSRPHRPNPPPSSSSHSH